MSTANKQGLPQSNTMSETGASTKHSGEGSAAGAHSDTLVPGTANRAGEQTSSATSDNIIRRQQTAVGGGAGELGAEETLEEKENRLLQELKDLGREERVRVLEFQVEAARKRKRAQLARKSQERQSQGSLETSKGSSQTHIHSEANLDDLQTPKPHKHPPARTNSPSEGHDPQNERTRAHETDADGSRHPLLGANGTNVKREVETLQCGDRCGRPR